MSTTISAADLIQALSDPANADAIARGQALGRLNHLIRTNNPTWVTIMRSYQDARDQGLDVSAQNVLVPADRRGTITVELPMGSVGSTSVSLNSCLANWELALTSALDAWKDAQLSLTRQPFGGLVRQVDTLARNCGLAPNDIWAQLNATPQGDNHLMTATISSGRLAAGAQAPHVESAGVDDSLRGLTQAYMDPRDNVSAAR